MRRRAYSAAITLAAWGIAAQADAQSSSAAAPMRGPMVSGVVHDSLAQTRLVGATVQLVSADSLARFGRTVMSDAAGTFAFDTVPDGSYTLGFYHPVLDSLGLDPLLRAVTVQGQRVVRADLAIPGLPTFRAAACGATSASAGAVVMGSVRDARTGAPIVGATIAGQWAELSFSAQGMQRRTPRRVATSKANGWYAVCNAPNPGTMTLVANHGADSTDVIEVQVPAGGFLRRELYIGPLRTVIIPRMADSVARAPADSAWPLRRLHVGDGRLNGVVVGATGGRSLAGAQVGIVNGPQTRTNERGEWTLTDAPMGTRSLEVRAVGYYPARQSVDVVEGAASVTVALATFKSVLDTMKVRADADRFNNLAGFRERRRSGLGRFLDVADIARRTPTYVSELFRTLPGVYLDDSNVETRITMRGTFEDRCIPAVFVDGRQMLDVAATDIDNLISIKQLAAVEVYSASQAPPPFLPTLSGCGSIVFWTK